LLGGLARDNLNDTRSELLNDGDMVSENTNITSSGGQVNLSPVVSKAMYMRLFIKGRARYIHVVVFVKGLTLVTH
jgi:hypothetical protein